MRVEERLDRLENELAIRVLAHEYCHGADKQDRARFASVWAPDGVWAVSDEQEFSGVAAICDAVTQQWDAFRGMHHWTANHVVTFDGDDPDCAAGEADVRVLIVFMGRDTVPRGWHIPGPLHPLGRRLADQPPGGPRRIRRWALAGLHADGGERLTCREFTASSAPAPCQSQPASSHANTGSGHSRDRWV